MVRSEYASFKAISAVSQPSARSLSRSRSRGAHSDGLASFGYRMPQDTRSSVAGHRGAGQAETTHLCTIATRSFSSSLSTISTIDAEDARETREGRPIATWSTRETTTMATGASGAVWGDSSGARMIPESRRVLYVGASRAQRLLILSPLTLKWPP
jgi:hypothetical protein